MPVTPEDERKADRVVEESKRTAHVDTGRLKRSIYSTVAKGQIVFRQYHYGIYNDNSKLEQNAKRMMGDTPYSIELLDEEGKVDEVIKKRPSGRTTKTTPSKKRENNARKLIAKNKEKKKKDGEKDSDQDN